MNFNEHSNLKGLHSFLSASNYHWINDDDEKFVQRYKNYKAAQRGTEDHEFAALCIQRHQKLPKSNKTLNLYVNDAVGYRMTPEVVLKYSDVAFATADAIMYDEKQKVLRIHDLKTGVSPTSMYQLMIYAAYFCLEYDIKPMDIFIELRIYQSNEVAVLNPDPDDIFHLMDLIVLRSKQIIKMNAEER